MKRAIIADDEILSRELLKNLISRYHLPVTVVGEAGDGDRALSMICDLNPDIVFLDIEMPGRNGLEIMRALKQSSSSAKIKIIIITAYDRFEYAQTALRLGAKDILLKPIDYHPFIEMMQRIGYKYTDHPAFNELLEYIDETYCDNLCLEDYAKHIHMSSGYITRLFGKYFNTSFKAWINGIKIREAMRLLEESSLSIKEISDRVGYNNLNYFYRKFNTVTGTTPKQFRD
ncbi:MAG: response regulator [Clostridiales Family XIII bacterium]|jgi:YesN/AraC family two-component response regulator|nr:response regulator [Clostridiales Family XIII bacterium]